MDDIRTLNRRYESITWGALFLWTGVRDLIPGLPAGTGLLGVGLILLGSNLARRFDNLPMNGVSATLGVMALCLSAVVLFLAPRGIRVDLPFFPVVMVVIGVIFLVHGATGITSATPTKSG
jgi:hypothetical protein